MSVRDADAWDWLWMPSGGIAGIAAAVFVVVLVLTIVPAMWPLPVSSRFAPRKRSATRGAKVRSAVFRSAPAWLGPLLILVGLVALVVRPASPVVLVLSSRSHATPAEDRAFRDADVASPLGFDLVDLGPAVDRALEEWQSLKAGQESESDALRRCVEVALSDPMALEQTVSSIGEVSYEASNVRRDIVESIELGLLRMATELRNVAGIIVDVEPRATLEGVTWSDREARLLQANGSRYRSNFVHFERSRSAQGITLLGVADRLSRRSGRWRTTVLLDVDDVERVGRATLRGSSGARASVQLRDLRPGVSLETLDLNTHIREGETYDLSVEGGPFFEIGHARASKEWRHLPVVLQGVRDERAWREACDAVSRQLQDEVWRRQLQERVGYAPRTVCPGFSPAERDAPVVLATERGLWICRSSDTDKLPDLETVWVDRSSSRASNASSVFMAEVIGGTQVGMLSWRGIQLRSLKPPPPGERLAFARPRGEHATAVRLRALMESLDTGIWTKRGTRVVPMLCRVNVEGNPATFLAIDPLAFDLGFVGERGPRGPMSGEKWWTFWATLFEAAASLEAGPTWAGAPDGSDGRPPRFVVDGAVLDRVRAEATKRSSVLLLLGFLLYSVVVVAPVAGVGWRKIRR